MGEDDKDESAELAEVNIHPDNTNNPYFTIELIFLAICGVGLVVMFIYVQKHEWMETLRVLSEQRANKRKYGFNRINVVFDTEQSESDYSDPGKPKIDLSLSGDEDVNDVQPINDSEIQDMLS